MSSVHNLLKRQIKRYLNKDRLEDFPAEWKSFLESVNEAYFESDDDRRMMERSMEINSQELLEINAVIRERERRLRALLDNVEFVAVGLDKDGNVEYVNPFLLKLTGYEKNDILGEFWAPRLFPKNEDAQTKEGFQKMLQKTVSLHEESSLETKSGEERLIAWNNILLHNEAGVVIGTVSIGEDITDKRKMLKKIVEAEKTKTVAQLAAGVAHEVKNPLAIVLQGVEYCARSKDFSNNKVVSMILTDMQNAVFRADSIIKGILDLSRPTQLARQPDDINSIIENTLLLLKNQLDCAHIQVVRKLKPGLPRIDLDKEKMMQVFINLFNNAQEAMAYGGVLMVNSDLLVTERGQQIFVTIEDTGAGIPEDQKHRLFDPFFTTKRGQGGTGLGLPIVQNIIQMHQATVEIANRPNGGVQVKLLFPVENKA